MVSIEWATAMTARYSLPNSFPVNLQIATMPPKGDRVFTPVVYLLRLLWLTPALPPLTATMS
jgi:hypothetical protein